MERMSPLERSMAHRLRVRAERPAPTAHGLRWRTALLELGLMAAVTVCAGRGVCQALDVFEQLHRTEAHMALLLERAPTDHLGVWTSSYPYLRDRLLKLQAKVTPPHRLREYGLRLPAAVGPRHTAAPPLRPVEAPTTAGAACPFHAGD